MLYPWGIAFNDENGLPVICFDDDNSTRHYHMQVSRTEALARVTTIKKQSRGDPRMILTDFLGGDPGWRAVPLPMILTGE